MARDSRDRVNCYLPRELKDRALEELGPEFSFSEVLRLGVIAALSSSSSSSRASSSSSTGR